MAREGIDADLIFGNRRDVDLTKVAPMHLDIVTPRRDLVVPAKAQALAPEGPALQTSPVTYAGAFAIRTDEISVAINLTTDSDRGTAAQIYPGSPFQPHPNFLRPVKESTVQIHSPYS